MKHKAVVIGCGLMGRDISAIFGSRGWSLTVVTREVAQRSDKAEEVRRSIEQLGGDPDEADLTFVRDVLEVDFTGVRIVIESVSEQLELKRALFRQMDSIVPQDVPIGTNSSGLRISDIARDCESAHRMANTHFFLPAHIVPLVEIARGERTLETTCTELRRIFLELGRVPVVVQKDMPGFLANRMQHALMREAFWLIDAGLATAEDVNDAVRYGFGFRYVAAGPILQKELAGLETQFAAATAIYPSLCNAAEPAGVLRRLVEQGKYGVKSGEGFRRWTADEAARARESYETTLLAAAKLLAA